MTKTNPQRSHAYRETDAMKQIAYLLDGLWLSSPYDAAGVQRNDFLGRDRIVAWIIAYFDLPFDRRPNPPPAPLTQEISGDGYAVAAFPELPAVKFGKGIEVTDEAD